MDKMEMTGSRAQLYNGILLLATFGICRLVFGTWQSYLVMKDLLSAVNASPTFENEDLTTMIYADAHTTAPWWAAAAYLLSNMTLNGLNFYWFFAMIRAVRKRFEPAKELAKEPANEPAFVTEADLDLSTVGIITPDKPQARRRKA
jgi:TLC domain